MSYTDLPAFINGIFDDIAWKEASDIPSSSARRTRLPEVSWKKIEQGGNMIDKIAEIIKKHEGLRLKPYRCSAGKLTIGYGRNIEDVGITQREAETLLANDLVTVTKDLLAIFPERVEFSENRIAALIDMRYQLGPKRFRGFKKMIAAILDGDWEAASIEVLDSLYRRQVPERALWVSTSMLNG